MNKRTFVKFILILVFVLSWWPVHADLINVISYEYSVRGAGFYYPFPPELTTRVYRSFNETSALPVSGLIEEAGLHIEARSSEEGIFVIAYDEGGFAIWTEAYASASISFVPLVQNMALTFIKVENVRIILTDTTLGLSLLPSYEDSYWRDLDYSSYNLYPVHFNLSHTYYMGVEGFSSVWTGAEMPTLAPVPEPTTILLLGFGLVGLAGIRKKIRN